MLGNTTRKSGAGYNRDPDLRPWFSPGPSAPRQIPDIPAGPAIEHRDFGIFVMAGPGIKKDELLYGANVLDIAPTLLTLYGLPVGEDMDGKVLSAAFEEPPVINQIPSWEDVPGDAGRHPAHTLLDPIAAREALQQMVALGYIADPAKTARKRSRRPSANCAITSARSYQNDDRALRKRRNISRTL